MKIKLPKFSISKPKWDKHIPIIFITLFIILAGSYFSFSKIKGLQDLVIRITSEKDKNFEELQNIKDELENLKNQDQIKRNNDLQNTIKNIESTYDSAVSVYEDLLDYKDKTKDTKKLDEEFSRALSYLKDRNYASASSTLSAISVKIKEEEAKLASAFTIPSAVSQNNTPPANGYSRQSVTTDAGTFMVSIVAGNLDSTKVIVDTASDSDCSDNCPVLALSDYVARSGAYAGVNGSYFCPSTYPTCAGKTNSFDLLLMNYKKTYFNSGNNVYSSNPAVIFGDNYIRYVTSASQWGRDTSPNGVLSNYPLLIFNGNISFGGDDDPKKGSKGNRSFVANRGNTIYIGVVHSVTVAESAQVMKTLGMENALNLDDGGSTALWSEGYKVGPGRNLPNAILFIRK